MKTILLLEDNTERIKAFQEVIKSLGKDYEFKIWRDAPSMCADCANYFATTVLISLDHDLNPQPGALTDPGTGLDVARFLGDFMPVCPVLIHSTNVDRVWSMHNELRFAGWNVDRIGPLGSDWIEKSWFTIARDLIARHSNTWKADLSSDHLIRLSRMKLSLDGLGIGDALGEMLSYQHRIACQRIAENNVPSGTWFHTDDTEMAISIAATLKSHGHVHQDALAKRFARRFERDPERGYGKMTRIQLSEINAGARWQETASNAFSGQGSMGNGGAMRVAPLGAYFADDLKKCAEAARSSSTVTHTHPEGVAGTIAVAIAAASSWQLRDASRVEPARELFEKVLRYTPESEVRRKLLIASSTPAETPPEIVAKALGNGSLVTAPDTVPFCIWMAAYHLDHFTEALGKTISVGGDCDTNAAIVGGIVALSAGRDGIPLEWLNARERFSL